MAHLYATTSPALVKCGWGQERNRNGGSSSMAILALPAVAGKFGVRGGGFTMSNTNAWGLERTWIRAQEPATRLVNMNHLGRALTEYRDPPVQLLFVYNSNAAVTSPNQTQILKGLEREDLFTVVFDQTMTDTAQYADVLLPATTFLESYDLPRGYGPISLRLGPPVIEPVGESRSNADVFGELLRRLDLGQDGDPQGELEELLDVLAQVPDPAGAELRAGRRGHPALRRAADPVRGRVPVDTRRKGASVFGAPRRRIAGGTVRLPAGSRHRRLSAGADFARRAIARSPPRCPSCRARRSAC